MKLTFGDYVREAFNARPMGMFVPPNWIGLGAFGLLGLLNPGFWIIGAGLEFAYLGKLATDPRFQRLVNGGRLLEERQVWENRRDELIRQLTPDDQQRYRLLEQRCGNIIEQQSGGTLAPAVQEQGEGLGRLLWIYLRLLLTRDSIRKIIKESSGSEDVPHMQDRIDKLQLQLKEPSLGEDLRKSLGGQIEILQQRQGKKKEAVEKLAFLDAELTRIQEQVELLREQAVLSTDPESVSQRIDQIATTLGGTSEWIRDQQRIYGAMEDLLADPPPLAAPGRKESQ